MKKPDSTARRRRGRPLSFDRDAALQQAMLLFWRHGYEATSISDLTAAMGVTPPSIYTAFGDKRELFRQAVHRYLTSGVTSDPLSDDAQTARDAVWEMLQSAAVRFTGTATPPGCLLASAAISCSEGAADVQRELAEIRLGIESRLYARIRAAVDAGELPVDTDADIMAVIQGMSTLARDGAPREKVLRVAAAAMLAWRAPAPAERTA
jgi:AcrR family transcriptional regulator